MKAEMRIKKRKTLHQEEERPQTVMSGEMLDKNRLMVCFRTCACIGLLALLGISGYAGARERPVKMAAAPVIHMQSSNGEESTETIEQIRMRIENERMQEIALLDSVLSHPQSDEVTQRNALAQKTQIASRMETEAQILAALSHMGFSDAQALCGAQMMTIILTQSQGNSEEQTVRVVDAVAGIAGVEPEDVKIILVKK